MAEKNVEEKILELQQLQGALFKTVESSIDAGEKEFRKVRADMQHIKNAMLDMTMTLSRLISREAETTLRKCVIVSKIYDPLITDYIEKEQEAMFHKFAQVYDNVDTGGIIEVAIVELEDGRVEEVLPKSIRFSDKKKGFEKKKA